MFKGRAALFKGYTASTVDLLAPKGQTTQGAGRNAIIYIIIRQIFFSHFFLSVVEVHLAQ
jgi:hypothetical protein